MSLRLEWPKITIRDVTLRTGTWNPETEPRPTLRYVDVSAVSRETLTIESTADVQGASAPSRARKIIHRDDTIFATIRPNLRRVAQVPKELHGEIASTAFCVLRPNRQLIGPDFLFFSVISDAFTNAVTNRETGASYPAVRDSDVLDQIIALPPLIEQSRITSVLAVLRASQLHQSATLEAAERLKRGTMRELFTRGLRGEGQKETEIGPIPKSWKTQSILDLCQILSGGTPRKSVPEYWTGSIPWASGKDLKVPTLDDTVDHLSKEGVEEGSRIVPPDTVLILVRGMGLAKDLPISVISKPMAFNQDLKALISRGQFSGKYIRSAVYFAKDRLLSRIVPSAHGTMTLNLDDIETFQIACPIHAREAEEIVAVLDAIDSKIDLHKRKHSVLDDLFKALLHKLMIGEIRVTDLGLSALRKDMAEPAAKPKEAHPGPAEVVA